MTKSSDAREDFVRRLGPHERLGAFVCGLDVPDDGRFQFAGAAMDAAPHLLGGERREPARHQVDPQAPVGVKCTGYRGWRTSQR